MVDSAVLDLSLIEKVEAVVSGLGYDLVDMELFAGRRVRVFIDVPSGVGVDDCARVSEQLTRFFSVISFEYERLEVSSPGLDRVLKKSQDFMRFLGRDVRVLLSTAVEGQRRWVGCLQSVENSHITLEVEGRKISFALAAIARARLVPAF